jgi:CO/xanthine dehydrogenase FAD-binding subunit
MQIGSYECPATLAEAYALIIEKKGQALGGAVWTNLVSKSLDLAVDLSGLGLRYIRERADMVEIGAMATARDVETSKVLNEAFGSLFPKATEHIVGVQLRNVVTVGGTVAGRYGFSDLNTVFAALDATIAFHGGDRLDFMEFMTSPRAKPFLLETVGVKRGQKAAYHSVRITNNDFPVINVCAAFSEGRWRIAVGARPAAVRLSPAAAAELGTGAKPSQKAADRAGLIAADELTFGDDARGSADYRKAVCAVLVRRAILEVAQ